jgi:uncharacterized UBP type Zn finger protein
MKAAFADFFSIKDCAKALKIHDDDIEEAAAWLCEQGENPSVKWQIPRSGIIPICESLISGKWTENGTSNVAQAALIYGAAVKGAENDIQVSKYSILNQSCIEPGKWTMSRNG